MSSTGGDAGTRSGVVRKVLATVVVALSVGFGPTPTAAQAPDTVQVRDTVPDRPMVPGGVYDKPYLTNLLGRTAIGGYAEAHARWWRVDGATDEAGFEARRVNLFTSTRVSDVVRMGIELEIEEGGEEIKLEYAAVDVTFHPSVSLRAGMILAPLGRFNLTHDAPRNHFTDRPLVATELLGVTLSQPGVGLFGRIPLGGGSRVTYEAYAVNGFDDGVLDSEDGTRLFAGRQNFEDGNRSPAVTGRVAWSPAVGTEFGFSGHRGAWNVFREEGIEVDERRDVSVLAVDFEFDALGFVWTGEGARVRVELPTGLVGLFQERQQGLYAQVVRRLGDGWIAAMPESYFEVGARVDAVDFDRGGTGDSRKQITFGAAFRPTADTALKLDYVRGRAFDAFNNREDHAALLMSVATYF